MPPNIPCEFFLIRYVPDVVKGEFTNIGVILREISSSALPRVSFTRDWNRVRCLHGDADIDMLQALEDEIKVKLTRESEALESKPILTTLEDSLSNSIQITRPQSCLAENLTVELIHLMRLYVDTLRVVTIRKSSGRQIIFNAMRAAFEKTGAWAHMQKNIAASQYTSPGDPLKIDCGYAFDIPDAERSSSANRDVTRIFQSISLEKDVEAAKSLAYSAPLLREGFILANKTRSQLMARPWLGLDFDLTAVVEPIRSISPPSRPEGDDPDDFANEAADRYRFGVSTMESAGIHVLTMNNLAAAAERARIELRL